MTEAGKHNIRNISETFGCDLVVLNPNIKAQKKVMRYTFEKYGKPTYFVDRYIYTYPLWMALKFNTPLLVYGENVGWEYGGADGVETYSARDQINNGVGSGIPDEEIIEACGIDRKDLNFFAPPSKEELAKLDPIYISYFTQWNSFKNYELAKKFGGIVISPEYRKSKKSPYPAAFDDCCRALEYMYNNAEKLGINKNKLIVGGESAGGGLAVAVCMYARDIANIPIQLQIPLYPMLDCDDTESSKNNKGYNWNTKKNHRGWSRYLGDLYKTDKVPKYASPSKEIDYHNLPPCFTYVLDGEPFYQETIDYIENLKKSNVVAKLDIYHGNIHGFDMLFWTKKAKRAKNVLYNDVREYFDE